MSINSSGKSRKVSAGDKDLKSRTQSQDDDLFSLTELLKQNANHIDNIE